MKNTLFGQWPPFQGWKSAPVQPHFISPVAEIVRQDRGADRRKASGPMGWEDLPAIERRRASRRSAWGSKA